MSILDTGLCRGKHQDIWYPPMDSPKSDHGPYNDVAKLVCDQCPIRAQCEELGNDEVWGTWGGVTERERRRGLPYKAPRKTITEAQVMLMVPRHMPDRSIDIRAVKEALVAVSQRKKPGQP